MFGSVSVGHHFAFRDVLFECWVDDDLLRDGVAGEFPDELVLVADFGVVVVGGDDLVVVLL